MPTATATETKNATPSFTPDVDATTERIRELNERILDGAKSAGHSSLDVYEQTVAGLVDFEKKVAGASQLDWVSAIAEAHSSFLVTVSQAYTKTARELLK